MKVHFQRQIRYWICQSVLRRTKVCLWYTNNERNLCRNISAPTLKDSQEIFIRRNSFKLIKGYGTSFERRDHMKRRGRGERGGGRRGYGDRYLGGLTRGPDGANYAVRGQLTDVLAIPSYKCGLVIGKGKNHCTCMLKSAHYTVSAETLTDDS